MKRLDDAIDYGSTGWDDFLVKLGSTWRDKDYRFLDKVFRISQLSGTLLDAGCALGDGLLYMNSRCPQVTAFSGTDFSREGVETCKVNPNLGFAEFYQHDLMNPLPRSYDNVICLQTLEHTPDPLRAFQHLIDATNKLLLVSVPYMNRRPDENHLWSFDESDFQGLTTAWCLGQKGHNIFWLVDRSKAGVGFRKRGPMDAFHRLVDSIACSLRK